eukprot:8935879-Alexandrium_andersonii.AAC.1
MANQTGVIASPIVKFICLKLAVLQKRYNVYLLERDALLGKLRTASAEQEQYAAYNAIVELDEEVEKSKKPIAFSGHPDSDRLFRVAQHDDEWTASGSGSLRAWCSCTATMRNAVSKRGT